MTTVGTVGIVLAPCNGQIVSACLIVMCLTLPISVVTYNLGPIDIAPNYAGMLLPLKLSVN